MFSLISRSLTKLNRSDAQLPASAKQHADVVAEDSDSEQPTPTPDVVVVVTEPDATPLQPQPEDGRPSASIYSSDEPQDARSEDVHSSGAVDVSPSPTPDPEQETEAPEPKPVEPSSPITPISARRFSFRPLAFKFMNGQQSSEEHVKPVLSAEQEHRKKLQVIDDRTKRSVRVSSADKKAKESAVVLRSLIVGPTGITLSDAKAKPISKPKVEKVKSQLLKPKTANRVIAQLRALPVSTDPLSHPDGDSATLHPAAPIHAVCLRFTDAEAESRHFSKLAHVASQETIVERTVNITSAAAGAASVYSASVAQLRAVFDEIDLVNLVAAPNMGFGAPGDAPGLFSGSVPTPDTIIHGMEEVTPQLMALGYATGKAILPDHSGIHPPTDRMSVLTYWWGFEVCMPPPTIEYLSNVPSIAHAAINVLTAMSVLNQGVREILPFVRYISSFIDTEFNMIKRMDNGKGVVCAATWLVPAALVPRAWDFTAAPAAPTETEPAEDAAKPSEPVDSDEPTASPHSPSVELPSSRPASPPTLLPPIAIHETSFDEPQVNNAPPVDDTSVEVEAKSEASESEDLPTVAVVPPTPTSVNSISSAETVTAV